MLRRGARGAAEEAAGPGIRRSYLPTRRQRP